MRGTTAGRRLIYLSLPFAAFGLLWALAPPTGDVGPVPASTVRTLGWILTTLSLAATAFGGYLLWRGDRRIV